MTSLLHTAVLLEGITHIEDLPLKEFIRTVESLKDKIVTEKLDGANLWFGLDDNGVFTSREGKSPKKGRFYDVDDYAMVANYNAFRAAHLAIEKMEPIIRKHFKEGDMAEIEVMFGRQPNTVTYGVANKNFIVILRGVNGTPEERVNALSDALNGKQTTVESTVVSSPDGETLELKDEKMTWEFTQVKPVDNKQIDTKAAMKLLASLKKFMAQPNETFADKTNEQVAELSLTSVPKEQREAAKKARETINAKLLNDFKAPIKELLLNNFVRKIKPFLQDNKLHPSEDIGVEGVVVRDPVTGSQTKIVDKDVFTAINTFNNAVRSTASGLVRTLDQDATAEMRGGAFGQAKIRIAELLGAKDLALSSGAKRFITKFKGSDESSTALAVANSLNINSLDAIRTKISAILKNTVKEVDAILGSFKQEAGQFKLTLKTGKEIGLTPEVMKRTLTAFAETKKDIAEINARVMKSRTPAELVMALYGKTIESLFSGGDSEVKESFSLIKSISEDGEAVSGAGPTGGDMTPATAGTADVKSGSTTAGNIAPVPFKLMKGSKMISRRPRLFVKPKKFPAPQDQKQMAKMGVPEGKFSMIKSVNEDWAHVSDMKFATDVDDTAQAQNDVEFNQLRNNVNIGDNVTQMDVNRYLDKAHELNDEVDTVTFGMETDDGSIVKVYVNATQADAFEAELAQLLGQEDDVEAVINQMADKFDIVDVEWPESMENPVDNASPESDIMSSDMPADSAAGEETFDEPVDMDFTTNTDIENGVTPEDEAVPPSEDPTDDEPAPSDEEPTGDEAVPPSEDPTDDEFELGAPDDSESSEDEPVDGEVPPDEEASDEEEELDDFGQPIKKKKKETTEESMKTIGERFKDKLLEAKKPKASDEVDTVEKEDDEVVQARQAFEKQMEKLLKAFTTKQHKAILTLMVNLGAPIPALNLHKAELRKDIDGAADKYISNSSFRMWVKKLLGALSTAETVTEASNFDQRLSNKYQHMVYHVLKAIGMPDSVEKTASRALLTGIKAAAAIAVKDSNTRIYLQAVADQLGIGDNFKNMSDPLVVTAEKSSKYKETAQENNDAEIKESVDDAVAAVNNLFMALGFDSKMVRSIDSQERGMKVRTPMSKLAANPTLIKKLELLTSMIADKTKSSPTSNQAPQLAHVDPSDEPVLGEAKDDAADQGKWIIGKMGHFGVLLKTKGMTIKVDDREAGKLGVGLDEQRKVSIRDGEKRFVFTPGKKGAFTVKQQDDDTKFPDGIHISMEEVQQILDVLATE